MRPTGLERLADRFATEKFIIGRDGDPYLTRWTLAGKRFGGTSYAVYLHRFHRSDHDHLHDHPWPFASIILAGGYYEHSFTGYVDPATGKRETLRKWYGPGRVLFRRAEWCHRIEVRPGVDTWSLVIRGVKRRTWFFHCPRGPVPWRDYLARYDDGLDVCAA